VLDPHVSAPSRVIQRHADLFNPLFKGIHAVNVPMDAVNVKVQAISTRLAHHHASERLSCAPLGDRVSNRISCRDPVVLRTLGVAPRDIVADAVPAGSRGIIAQLPNRLLAL
jgi:hypothetical protein